MLHRAVMESKRYPILLKIEEFRAYISYCISWIRIYTKLGPMNLDHDLL